MFFIMTPLPGTELYTQLENQGRIFTKNCSIYDGFHVVHQPTQMDINELEYHYWKVFRDFYSTKNILNRLLHNFVTSKDRFYMLEIDLFYQFYFAKKTSQRDHPFSGGIFEKSGSIIAA